MSRRHTDVWPILVKRTGIFIDNIRAEKSGWRKFNVEIRNYLKVWLAIFISVPSLSRNNAVMHLTNLIDGIPTYGLSKDLRVLLGESARN